MSLLGGNTMKIHPLVKTTWVVRKVGCVHHTGRGRCSPGCVCSPPCTAPAAPPVPGTTPEPALLSSHLPLVSLGQGPTGILPLKRLCWACVGNPPGKGHCEFNTATVRHNLTSHEPLGIYPCKRETRSTLMICFNHIRPKRAVFGEECLHTELIFWS